MKVYCRECNFDNLGQQCMGCKDHRKRDIKPQVESGVLSEEKEMKVYCRECMFDKGKFMFYPNYHICYPIINGMERPYCKLPKNENNSCPYYRPKLWVAAREWVRRVFR